MIPGIEEIIAGLLSGQYTKEQAQSWMDRHVQIAAESAPRGVEWPPQGGCEGDDFTWDFPLLHFGHGQIEVGDAKWNGLPTLFIGREGQGLGMVRDRNEPAKNGETLALLTFANLEGLEALEAAVQRVRAALVAQNPEAAPQATAALSHASEVLYPAIESAMRELGDLQPGFSQAVDRAFNHLHGAFWSECPAPASAAPLRPLALTADPA